jgi:LTXXQ motif family protein
MKTRTVLVLCAAALLVGMPAMTLAQATPTPATTKPAPAHASKGSTVDANEARIADLHAKLKITPAQEELWKSLTEVMRANAGAMEPLRKARAEKAPTMTAVEDFTSYAEIADVHADGVKKFVPVFTALYDSMSDAQKKNADTLFRRGVAPKKGSR